MQLLSSQVVHPDSDSWGDFVTEKEFTFSICETKGDSCMALGKTKEAKVFFEQALAIKKVCRVQQKLNEVNKLPVKSCPDLKTFSEMASRANSFKDPSPEQSDSMRKAASDLVEEIFYGIPKRLVKIRGFLGPTEAEMKLMQDSLDKMLNEALLKMGDEMMNAAGMDTMTTSENVETYIIPPYEEPEVLGDEKFKNSDFELARFYFEEALKEKPKDKILKKKIAECDKQIKKLRKKK
ncbi:MAG: hypothetical protein IAF38_03310 [Bacteroidia bacterium]|nr:hypothetical protein [Bacteroidia bacterium]